MENNTGRPFYINSRDFCCCTERLKRRLLDKGYKPCYESENRKKPGRKCYFFPMSKELAVELTAYLGREVIWDSSAWAKF